MLVKARKSKTDEWGLLEKYETYNYCGKGYIEALTAVTADKKLAPCYVFRGSEFVPIGVIEEEVGIGKYIKAKKPFYFKPREGFLVILKAKVDFNNKIYLEDQSEFEVYTLNGFSSVSNDSLPFKKVLDVPSEFADVVKEPLRILGESFGDREKFLKSRV